LFTLLILVQVGFAQSDTRAPERFMRAAERAMRDGRTGDAIALYGRQVEASSTIDTTWRELTIGNAYAGLAMCAALQHDACRVKTMIDSAAVHHYWLFNTYRIHRYFTDIVGLAYIDSMEAAWNRRQRTIMVSAPTQGVVMVHPKRARDDSAVVIAFHGGFGNPRQFALLWQDVADSLGLTVVIPPGVARISPEAYSWNRTIAPIDSLFRNLLGTLAARGIKGNQPLYLAGFSQGGHAALAVSLLHPERVRGALVLEGFSGPDVDALDLAAAAAAGTAIYAVRGGEGIASFGEEIARTSERCINAGVPFTVEQRPTMLHMMPDDLVALTQRALRWIDIQHQFHAADAPAHALNAQR
jgi:predicted esterase